MVLTNALMLVYNDATSDDRRSLSPAPGSLSDWFLSIPGTMRNPDGSVVFTSQTLNKFTVSCLKNIFTKQILIAKNICYIHLQEIFLFQGMNMSFPINNSFSSCYNDRKSCVERDFSAEVGGVIF